MIEGVAIKELEELHDARGSIQRMVRSDDRGFDGFGEIYFSITNPGVVKGWHVHRVQTNLLSCIRGTIRLVLFDERTPAPTVPGPEVIELGDGARKLVRVPPGVVYGWKNVGTEPAILANCASHIHDTNEARRYALDSRKVPYAW